MSSDGIPGGLGSMPTGILQDMAADADYQEDADYLADIQEELNRRGERMPDASPDPDIDDEPVGADEIDRQRLHFSRMSEGAFEPREYAMRPRQPQPTELPCGHPVTDLAWDEKRKRTYCTSCRALERAVKAIAKKDDAVTARAMKALRGWRPPEERA